MPAFPSLSDSQNVSIDLFLASIGPSPTNSGQTNFNVFCQGCHGAFGTGGPFFPSSVQGFTPLRDLVRQGRGEMPAVIESRLSAEALDSLEAYIAGLADLSAYTGEEYYQIRCAGCHGFEAEGTERGFQLRRPVDTYAEYVIREGRPGVQFPNTMPAYEPQHLSDTQLTELLDYLNSFPQPTTGEELYATYCANCHGIDGRGGPTRSDLRDAVGDPATFIEAIRSGNSGNRYWNRSGYMPRWHSGEISDSEAQAIIAYLAGL
jgi:mono/diheme cytochrome c family protein